MKGLFVVFVLIAAVYCQIGGTHGACSAVAIPGPFTEPISLFGSNSGATASAISCNSDDIDENPTVWYSVTPSSGTQLTISTCAPYTNFDTIIVVYTGNCEQLTCSTIADDSDSCQVNNNFAQAHFVSSGEQYFIGVTGYNGATGNFELTFSEVAANASSTCQTAIAIPGPYVTPVTVYGNTEHSGGYNGNLCGLSSSSHIDWYLINPHPGSQVEITTCNAVTNFDTRLSIFSGSCSSLRCMFENDDNCTTNSVASYLTFAASPNESHYYLAVFGYGSASGTYEVRIIEHPTQTVAGADCPSAVPIPYTPQGSALYFGNTENNPVSTAAACTSVTSKSYWYRLDIPSSFSGTVFVSTCNEGTSFDTILFVYTGSCDTLRCVAYNDDNCSIYSLASSLSFTVGSGSQENILEEVLASVSITTTPASSRSSTPSPSRTRMPTPSRMSSPTISPTRTPTAAVGTRTYFIQVAAFGSGQGNFALTVGFQSN